MPFADEILIGSTANAWTAPTITQGIPVDLSLTLTTNDAQPIDLTNYAVSVPGAGAIYGIVGALPITQGIVAVVTEYKGQAVPTAVIICSVAADKVVVPFAQDTFKNPGLYFITFLLVVDGIPVGSVRTQLAVEENFALQSDNAPLTMAEVRLWMRDNTADDNFLLDEVEYKDREVIAAIRSAVDMWNGSPPLLAHFNYTVNTFPQQFRQQWLEAAVGALKGIAANGYLRNNLPYAAGGVNIDERAKWQQYRQESENTRQEYKQWVTQTKAQLNREQCFTIINYRGGTRYGNY